MAGLPYLSWDHRDGCPQVLGQAGVTVTAERPLAPGRAGGTPWVIPVPCPPASHPRLLLDKGALLQPVVKGSEMSFPLAQSRG